MESRDQKLEEIVQSLLKTSLELDKNYPSKKVNTFLVDLKQAMQLAYQAGRDSK